MLAASACAIYLLFLFLWERPFGIFFVLTLTFFPGLVFLYLSCVRAGLVALKASGPPNMKKLGTATIRLFRFNIMLNNLIMSLVGLGGSVLIMIYLTPDIWADLSEGFEVSDLGDLTEILPRIGQVPLAVILMLTLALSLSNGIIGTSSASVAANAAEKGPNHHNLWGVTRQFLPLFVLSLLVLFVPAVILIQSLGGPLEPISNLGDLSLIFYACLPLYLVWAGCTICGGKALAYVQTVKDLESEWVKERDDMLGDIVPEDNLRALRQERQEASQLKENGELSEVDLDEMDNEDFDQNDLTSEDLPGEYDHNSDLAQTLETEGDTLTDELEPIEISDDTPDPDDTPEPEMADVMDDLPTEEEFRKAVEERMAASMAAKPKTKKRSLSRALSKQVSKAKPRAKSKAKAKAKAKSKAKTKTAAKK